MTNQQAKHKAKIDGEGYAIIDDIFSENEVKALIEIIENATQNSDNFRKSENLFYTSREHFN